MPPIHASTKNLNRRLKSIVQGFGPLGKERQMDLPCYSTWRNHWENPLLDKLAVRAQRQAVREIQGQREHLRAAVDGTKVELKLRVHKPFGRWGRTSRKEKFFGLKLHLAVSLKGVPLAWKSGAIRVWAPPQRYAKWLNKCSLFSKMNIS